MSALIINPGTGPVASATELQATANLAVFCDDLRAMDVDVEMFIRRRACDYGQGRYAYDLVFGDGRPSVEVQMPGIPVTDSFPRLYVNDSSWWWGIALTICAGDD
jgi:hypothetical protein